MTTSRAAASASRRAALAGLGAGSLGAALALAGRPAAAQGTDLAGHPLAGAWLAMANPPLPGLPFAVPSFFNADGTVVLLFPPVAAGPQGPQFQAAVGGTWEADGDRRGHFTAVQALAAADGAYLGTVTIDGHPEVSEDGQGFVDADPRSTVTIRDAAGAVVQEFAAADAPPVIGNRIAVGQPNFPLGTRTDATPETGTPTT